MEFNAVNNYLGTTEPALDCWNTYLEAASTNIEPRTWEEAIRSPQREHWIEAHTKEWENHKRNHTFNLVPRPANTNIIKSRIVFKTKHIDSVFSQCRVRFVGKGFTQVPGVDFADRFSATAQNSVIRVLLVIASRNKWKLHSLDITAAFLSTPLEEEIFMEPPPGCKEGRELVWKLRAGVNGVVQSWRNHWRRL
eukprot:3529917-Rhodomonas_salina.1